VILKKFSQKPKPLTREQKTAHVSFGEDDCCHQCYLNIGKHIDLWQVWSPDGDWDVGGVRWKILCLKCYVKKYSPTDILETCPDIVSDLAKVDFVRDGDRRRLLRKFLSRFSFDLKDEGCLQPLLLFGFGALAAYGWVKEVDWALAVGFFGAMGGPIIVALYNRITGNEPWG